MSPVEKRVQNARSKFHDSHKGAHVRLSNPGFRVLQCLDLARMKFLDAQARFFKPGTGRLKFY